jgi:hypothetical protein
MKTGIFYTFLISCLSCVSWLSAAAPPFPKTREEVIALTEDVWAEAAIRQPGGPSYEFFRDLFPRVKYVNADFHVYPIVLSAPGAKVKARYVSNGSAINPKADKKPMWYDPAFGVEFFVGEKMEPYGADPERLDGPRFAEGWLPIVQTTYKVGDATVEQEVFASIGEIEHGSVFVRFTARGAAIIVTARVRADGALTHPGGGVCNADGSVLAAHSEGWQWNAASKELSVRLDSGQSHDVLVLTKGMKPEMPVPFLPHAGRGVFRSVVVDGWKQLLARGVNLEVPEPIVQNAWRACVVGNEMLAVGDRMNYSAGNAYDHLYEGECGDATRALMLYGQVADARRFIGPLLDFPRQDTKYHVAGHKLQLLAHYYLVTRDKEYMKEKEAVWNKVIDLVINNRSTENGLLPPDRYAGDINKPVLSLSSNSACWRGLRDMAVVLHDLGEHERAAKLEAECKEYKAAILAAVAKSERHETNPPFIPIPLMADEKPFSPLTATRLGSYYDLMIPYVLGSDIFMGSERETWIIGYLRQHGGLAMGMIRNQSHSGPAANEPANNVLYGLRYMLTILRRDDVGHALAGFYGQLAQAMTRDTFIGGEASRLFEGDSRGRQFYLPPNSAANAMFLETLRYLLIQDWQDETGKPHELRLLHGVPGRWLEDGKSIKFQRAPTLFGLISFRVYSQLTKGVVTVDIEAPPRAPDKWLMRLPLPPGWKVTRAKIGEQTIKTTTNGDVDLTGERGSFQVRYDVKLD